MQEPGRATPAPEELIEVVRRRYGEAARAAIDRSASCCGPAGCGCGPATEAPAGPSDDATILATGEVVDPDAVTFGPGLYDAAEASLVPEAARLASLGCGNPTAVAELRPGETVLDLGSGGGLDVILSAHRVGPTGFAYGLDMTPEMLELARRNAAEAGVANVEFLEGRIEAVPLPDASVDVVISNCVINLSIDKPAVFREIARVLQPGGRVGVADVVARDDLDPAERAARGSYVGCIAGALSFAEYEAGLRAVGLTDVSVHPTHEVADGMFAAIIRARKPVSE
ncbi:MAG TPA: arsenite methyltransferase [Candidatus Binatia bacterium]|nr:arsenite methyltransferase [Candidatus Binatia bacterium]